MAQRAVRRFLPGEGLEDALDACEGLARRGIPATLTYLGENVAEIEEAEGAVAAYLAAVAGIRARGLDIHLSVKPTHLGLDLGVEGTEERLLRLAGAVEGSGVPLWLDMEDATHVDRTLRLYRALLREAGPRVGICLQAYLHRTPRDLEGILADGGRVRLVKGAYRESPSEALQDPAAVDGSFLALAERLGREGIPGGGLRHVLGTHDLGLLGRLGLAPGESAGPGGPVGRDPAARGPVERGPLEVQMLYGIQGGAWDALVGEGIPFRVLVSYGAHWYPWFMRRLAERPTNLRFLLRR